MSACATPPQPVTAAPPPPQDGLSLRAFVEIYSRVQRDYLFSLDPAWLLSNAEAGLRGEPPRSFSLADAMQGRPPVVMPSLEPALPLDEVKSFTSVLRQREEQTGTSESLLLRQAVRAMLAGLDPKSSYVDREEFRAMSLPATAGVGLEVGRIEGRACVRPLPDSPAIRAGVRAGDMLLAIDGASVDGEELPEIIDRLRGAPDSAVLVRLQREGQAIDLSMQRQRIEAPGATLERLDGDLLHLRVGSGINFQTANQIRRLIEAQSSPVRGLLLDLRGNTGGVLQTSVQIADLFLSSGRIGQLLERDRSRDFDADPAQLLPGVPMVVLVDRMTAAGAELIAAALQAHGRATILGERTYGFGSVQTILPLHDEGAIRITTGLLYQDYRQPLEGRGVTPDQPLTAPPASESCALRPAQGQSGDADAWQAAALTRLRAHKIEGDGR